MGVSSKRRGDIFPNKPKLLRSQAHPEAQTSSSRHLSLGTNQCRACLNLRRIFRCPFSKKLSITLCTLEDLFSSVCEVHHSIVFDVIPKFSLQRSSSAAEIKLFKLRNHAYVLISIFHRPPSDGSFHRHPSPPQMLALVKERSSSADIARGIILDHNWIDVGLLRRWRRNCAVQHGSACTSFSGPQAVLSARPSLLIDAWKNCLVYPTSEDSYVALSYVWGGVDSLKTVRSNLQDFLRENAFSVAICGHRIPKTILDAIHLTSLFRERYLWVDSLCIIQDDQDFKHREITNMAAIYAKASLTLIAAQGKDANFGLHGIRGIARPRQLQQKVFKIDRRHHIIHHPMHRTDSAWHQRGWTYQEDVLSYRCLMFDDDTVRWQCRCATWYEDLQPEHKGYQVPNGEKKIGLNVLTASWPNLNSFGNLVCYYNERAFTYPEDALAGFSGILSVLSRKFEGGFLQGLPEMFLDIALLWQPYRTVHRRVPSNICSRVQHLPSWSWVGWHGTLCSVTWQECCDYIKKGPNPIFDHGPYQRTIPTVNWSCAETLTSDRRKIQCTWTAYRQGTLQAKPNLPAGWARHSYQPTASVQFKSFSKYQQHFYTHQSDPSVEFWYPVPIRDQTVEPTVHPTPNFLFCRTQTAALYLGERLSTKTPIVWLQDASGRWAGVLIFHNQHELNSAYQDVDWHERGCHLVAISMGNVFNDECPITFNEANHTERDKSGDIYEFYNVLCVKWREGVAYRKGLGRVAKELWECQSLDWIDLILG
jgi:Heterokaryon incompatibility protein (HET)